MSFFKNRSFLIVIFCVLSFVPLFVIGMYDYPSADDFSMGLEAGRAFRETGSVFAAISAAFGKTVKLYDTWIGYYSSSFLSALPPHTWGESLYRLTVFISCGAFVAGTSFFLYTVLVKIHRGDIADFSVICAVTVFISIQCLPEGAARVEGLYWYSGSINYTFMYGVALCYVACMMRYCLEGGRGDLTACVILGFITGGANYMTALCATIVSALVVLRYTVSVIADRRTGPGRETRSGGILLPYRSAWVLLPVLVQVSAFAVSCAAPGNRVRGALTEGLPAGRAIIMSAVDVLKYCVAKWTTWPVILAVLFLVPFMWRVAERSGNSFRLPGIALIFAWGFAAANVTPPLFATGNIEAGRIQAIFWMQYVLLLVLSAWYITGYAAKRLRDKERLAKLAGYGQRASLILCVVFLAGSLLSVRSDPQFYTSSAALRDVVNGKAAGYAEENRVRQELLDGGEEDGKVKLAPHEYKPSLLFFSDITEDTSDWSNKAMASYYAKRSVRLR